MLVIGIVAGNCQLLLLLLLLSLNDCCCWWWYGGVSLFRSSERSVEIEKKMLEGRGLPRDGSQPCGLPGMEGMSCHYLAGRYATPVAIHD